MCNEIRKEENIGLLQNMLDQLREMEQEGSIQLLLNQMRFTVEKLNEELTSLKKEALEAKREQSRFISLITHELRIPLTSIKGYTDLLRKDIVGPVNEQQSGFLNIIRTNVDRMSELISNLSDINYMQTGRLKLYPQKTDLVDWIHDQLLVWRPRFAGKDQLLLLNMDPSLPSMDVDTARLTQVLSYLLDNASRYTPEQENVELILAKNNGMLRIEVRDNGIGIDPDDLPKLFTPFFRSEAAEVRDSPGWGLSLYVAKLLVDLMGGKIGTSSQPGKGSTFWIEIPITK